MLTTLKGKLLSEQGSMSHQKQGHRQREGGPGVQTNPPFGRLVNMNTFRTELSFYINLHAPISMFITSNVEYLPYLLSILIYTYIKDKIGCGLEKIFFAHA